MTLRPPIVLGNWKMHGLRADGLSLAKGLAERSVASAGSGTLGIFPPATLLGEVADVCAGTDIVVGGQDCHEAASGAYTGSLSAAMLADLGARAVILGHSERRHGLAETDERIRAKVGAAMSAGLMVVLCVGETEAEYRSGRMEERIRTQIAGSVHSDASPERLVVAYEPVWAIGTGLTAEPADIERSHAVVREGMREALAGGEGVPVLYGGSVKPANAGAIMVLPGVDGVLVGGASLDVDGFWSIYEAGLEAAAASERA